MLGGTNWKVPGARLVGHVKMGKKSGKSEKRQGMGKVIGERKGKDGKGRGMARRESVHERGQRVGDSRVSLDGIECEVVHGHRGAMIRCRRVRWNGRGGAGLKTIGQPLSFGESNTCSPATVSDKGNSGFKGCLNSTPGTC